MTEQVFLTDLASLGIAIADVDRRQAERAGLLRRRTRAAGLSLGDRACLALALDEGAVALTTDRAWTRLDLGVAVEVIR